MATFPSVILHDNKIHAVKRFHPWVFSGAVKKKEGSLNEGDVVEVYSDKGEYLGTGHYGTGSIAVRIFSFEKAGQLNDLWQKKFESAYRLRQVAGLAENAQTNAYRLLNAEGDGMPGLIVDWYNGTAVIQAHSRGMYNERQNFAETIKAVYGNSLKAVYDKSSASMHHKQEDSNTQHSPMESLRTALSTQHSLDSYLYGKPTENIILENNHCFKVDWEHGQKTGFFIDQRDNRFLLSKYAAGKKVLNTFCYSGGFSVYALQAGAKLVHSVDSSAKAIELTDENIKLNANSAQHQSFTADIFDFMKDADDDYEVIVLDPPAFAKGQSARHQAIKAYTRLNYTALKKIKTGGIVFTFSCSQAVNTEMFEGAVTAAAIESGRNIRILHRLAQPADHPVSIYHPEGLYLKGLVLYVE